MDAILGDLALGNLLEEEAWPPSIGILDRRSCVALIFRNPNSGQELLPGGQRVSVLRQGDTRRSRVDVAEHISPERRQGSWISAIEGDLKMTAHVGIVPEASLEAHGFRCPCRAGRAAPSQMAELRVDQNRAQAPRWPSALASSPRTCFPGSSCVPRAIDHPGCDGDDDTHLANRDGDMPGCGDAARHGRCRGGHDEHRQPRSAGAVGTDRPSGVQGFRPGDHHEERQGVVRRRMRSAGSGVPSSTESLEGDPTDGRTDVPSHARPPAPRQDPRLRRSQVHPQ